MSAYKATTPRPPPTEWMPQCRRPKPRDHASKPLIDSLPAKIVVLTPNAMLSHPDCPWPHYSEVTGLINIPDDSAWEYAEPMWHCILHEVGHWTGGVTGRLEYLPIGDPHASAHEECIAEMVAFLLSFDVGMNCTAFAAQYMHLHRPAHFRLHEAARTAIRAVRIIREHPNWDRRPSLQWHGRLDRPSAEP